MNINMCKYCGRVIAFNAATKKWVTSKDHWKCLTEPEHFPVRAHCPKDDPVPDIRNELLA